jgi:hypothetical protein
MSRSSYELERLKKFVLNYRIDDFKVEQQRQAETFDHYAMGFSSINEYTFNTQIINVCKMSMPEQSLDRIVNIVTEYEELMKDPETAKLLMEARFINRLKYGSKI